MRPSRRPLSHLNAAVLCLLVSFTSVSLAAQTSDRLPASWNDAVRTLADKILAALPAVHSIALDVNNISSLQAADAAEIQRSLEGELARHGIHVGTASSAEADVKLTLSEGVEGYVWAAEIRHGDQLEMALVSAPRQSQSDTQAAPVMSLKRERIWAQARPFLDFAASGALSSELSSVLLEPGGLYGFQSTRPAAAGLGGGTFPHLPPTRDPRGEIVSMEATTARAYVEGVNCSGSWGSTVHVDCDAKSPLLEEEYPVEAGRNYFSAFESSGGRGTNQKKFFSAAIDPTPSGESRYILAELDGKSRLYDNSTSAAAVFEGWGDDIATIRAGCDGGWQVLVTSASDWTQADQIQIYEIRGNQAIPAGQALNFPGPILALRTATDGKSARVVSRNLQTGMYEASIVTVVCGN
jgi:hypothetical protein